MPRNIRTAQVVDSQPRKLRSQPQDYQSLGKRASELGDWAKAARYYEQAIEERSEELALINSVQEGLSSQLEMESIYNLVGDRLRDTFDAQVVMISQYDPLTNKVFHHYAIEKGQHLHIPGWHTIDTSRLAIVRTRRPFMINAEEIMALLEAAKMKVIPGTEIPRTWLGAPMLVGNEVKGIVSLQNLDKENAFTQADIDLLMTLTNSMSLSLENARLYKETQGFLTVLEREMEIARQTQQSILPPRLPRHPGYELGSMMIPAQAVGGDFYDFIPLHRHQLCIVIGDVSDKGLPAALIMALTFSLVRAETRRSHDPRQILQNINRYLLSMNATDMYVTLLYCVLDFKTGTLKYCRAGHLPPMILNAEGQFSDLPMDLGQPLGLFGEPEIDQHQVVIPKGGLALLFSDGLNEAADTQGLEFGFERIRQNLLDLQQEKAPAICNRLWQAVQVHSGELPHQDDFTAVVIKRGLAS